MKINIEFDPNKKEDVQKLLLMAEGLNVNKNKVDGAIVNKEEEIIESKLTPGFISEEILCATRKPVNSDNVQKRSKRIVWTKEQDDIIKENYATMNIDELVEKVNFTGVTRSDSAIIQRAFKFGIKKKKKSYIIPDIGGRIPKPESGKKFKKLGNPYHNPWTEEQVAIVKMNYGKISINELKELVDSAGSERTEGSIRTRASYLGLSIHGIPSTDKNLGLYKSEKEEDSKKEVIMVDCPMCTEHKVKEGESMCFFCEETFKEMKP